MITKKIPELKRLTSEEKLILIRELWEELASKPDSFPPREEHIKILKERVERYRNNPGDAMAWEQVKARILASR